uniref:Uncharacterized protein n=1 Tax=viral metagenome TaxID=1070528 RepID=A0A6M3JT65_9ZZZZ
MAIDEVPQTGQQMRYGIAAQSAFGTAVLDSAAFTELDCEHVEINRDVKTVEVPGAHGTRNKRMSDVFTHGKACMPSFSLSAIVKKEELALWLYLFFQNVTEGATTPYDKTYVHLAAQPDFQADAGMWATFVAYDPAASKSFKVIDCIMSKLAFTLTKGEMVKMAADFVGRGLPSVLANPSGTWTRNAVSATNLFYWADLDRMTMNFGSGDKSFHCEEAGFELSQDVIMVGQDAANPDGFQTYALTNRQSMARVKVIKDSDSHSMLAAHAANTASLNLNVGWGNATPGTVDGDFDFECNGKITEQPTIDKSDPMMVDCPMTLLESDNGATAPVTVVMADAVEKAW